MTTQAQKKAQGTIDMALGTEGAPSAVNVARTQAEREDEATKDAFLGTIAAVMTVTLDGKRVSVSDLDRVRFHVNADGTPEKDKDGYEMIDSEGNAKKRNGYGVLARIGEELVFPTSSLKRTLSKLGAMADDCPADLTVADLGTSGGMFSKGFAHIVWAIANGLRERKTGKKNESAVVAKTFDAMQALGVDFTRAQYVAALSGYPADKVAAILDSRGILA